MKKSKNTSQYLAFFMLSFFAINYSSASAGGAFGSEIYCTMRNGGNPHEESWVAAYDYIKRQKGGLFKTSPNQAAGQIVETVVRERDKFEYCLQFLSDLYPKRDFIKKNKNNELMTPEETGIEKDRDFDRYSY